jgi:ribonuclease Z
MRPSFRTHLANGVFEDPVLYVDFVFEKRALLFDAGNLRNLATRKLLRVSDVMISHAHMDHFADFDWLLRLMVGRDKTLRVFGPIGLIQRIEHKLSAYSWNLVHNYSDDLVIVVTELISDREASQARFRCRNGFQQQSEGFIDLSDGVIIDEPAFLVRTAIFEHDIPCLGYCLEEKQHVNVWKNRLEALQLPVGPWLRDLKQAVFESKSDDTLIRVWWVDNKLVSERFLPLGILKKEILRVVSGQKIGYLVDIAFNEPNRNKAIAVLHECDLLFIECAFMQEHADIAASRNHLTAHQAGLIAKAARAKQVIPIHFSPRYWDREHALRAEVEAALDVC